MTAADQILAFDKQADNREFDADGRMHVKLSNVSKATVNPYLGDEIPDFEKLGLDPKRVYMLLRDPDELSKAAPTSNKIQLLRRHIAVSADDPKKDDVVGCFGEAGEFVEPYLQNSLAIWDAEAIAGVESRDQCEISMSYRYDADMTPGTYKGLRYDGIMRNISFNHGALVEQGRAGSDVLVGDSQLGAVSMPLKSRKALMVRGALAAFLPTKLAAGQTLAFDSVLGDVNRDNYKAKKPAILAAIKPKLAADADLDAIHKLLDSLDNEEDGASDEMDDVAEDEDKEDEADRERAEDDCDYGNMNAKDRKAWDAKWASDRPARDSKRAADRAARDSMDDEGKKAEDRAKRARDRKMGKDRAKDAELEKDKPEAMDKRAMDAAIKLATDATVAKMQAIRDAERMVEPITGPLAMAMDSAEDIYKFGLETLGVDIAGLPPSAYAAVLKMQPKTPAQPTRRLAMDAATGAIELFPEARRIGQV